MKTSALTPGPNSLRFLALLGAACFTGIPPACAGIIVSSSASAPSTDLLASFEVGADTNAYVWRRIGSGGLNRVEMGPSFFVPGAGMVSLQTLTMRAREFGTAVAGSNYTLELWSFTDALDTVGDALIDTQAGVMPAGLAAPSYWTFDFDDITVAAGAQYGFVLSFTDGADSQRFVHFVQDFVNGYPGGRLVSRAGDPLNWDFGGHDLTFYVQGAPTAVPEPSSAALALAGCAGLALRRRKPRR